MTDFLNQLGRNLDDAARRLDQPARRPRRAPALALVVIVLLVFGVGVGAVVLGGGKRTERERVAAPTETATKQSRTGLGPIAPVLARIGEHVDVPVGVPANLPEGTRAYQKAYLSNRDGVRRAQISLRIPGERASMVIQYGEGGFDGCGPSDPRDVDVNGEPGVVSASSQGVYSTVVWPAELPETTGTYALSGPFSPAEALRYARSMQLSGESAYERSGC